MSKAPVSAPQPAAGTGVYDGVDHSEPTGHGNSRRPGPP